MEIYDVSGYKSVPHFASMMQVPHVPPYPDNGQNVNIAGYVCYQRCTRQENGILACNGEIECETEFYEVHFEGSSPHINEDNSRYTIKRFYVTMPNGSTLEFRKDDTVYRLCDGQTPPPPGCLNNLNNTTLGTYLSVDGSGMRLEISNEPNEPRKKVLYLPGGGKYVFSPSYLPDLPFEYGAEQYIDANGNQTHYQQNATTFQRKIVDTMGREILDYLPLNSDVQKQQVGTQTFDLNALNGQPQSYSVKWEQLKDPACDNVTTPGCGNSVLENDAQELYYRGENSCVGNQTLTFSPSLFDNDTAKRVCARHTAVEPIRFNPVVLSEITLPNGEKYKFKYNIYGEITKIIYPTGSSERFRYEEIPVMGYETDSIFDQTNRGVVERWVYEADGSQAQHWVYEVPASSNTISSPYIVKTTAPDGTRTEKHLHRTHQLEYGFSNPLSGMPFDEKVFDNTSGNGQLRSRTLTDWTVKTISYTRDPRVKRKVSIVIEGDKALATLGESEYDETGSSDPKHFSHLNVKRSKSYHYIEIPKSVAISANLSWSTIESYFLNASVASISETDYLYDQTYLDNGITSLPIRTEVLNPNDPEEILAKTETIYDVNKTGQPSTTPYSGQVSYTVSGTLSCTTASGSVECWKSRGTEYLGRPTTSRLWDKDNNGTWIESHTQYDIFGNAVKAKDAIQNEVQTNYTSTYKYAYPETVITSAPDPTGIHGTNLTSQASSTYDLTTGLPLTATDDFGQTTKTEYDSFLRPVRTFGLNYSAPESQTVYGVPVNGQLPSNQRFIKVIKQIDANNWDEAITWFDGLGRTIMSKAADSQGDIFVETLYDNFGRVKATSQPYRAGDARLWSVPRYDELNRAVESFTAVTDSEISNPPSSKSTGVTSFGISNVSGLIGTYTVTTDASGRKGRSVTNSLGQLARVDEPTAIGGAIDADLGTLASPHQPTYYTYDIKGNMVKAQQGKTGDASIQYRYFKYDSLGRLIRVKQPEQEVNASLYLEDSFNTSGQWTAAYKYDGIGNLIRTTDATGVNIINEYDKAGRVTRRCYSDPNLWLPSATNCGGITGGNISDTTPEVKYYYDGKGLAQEQAPHNYAKGKLTKVTSSISETQYTLFDNFGRLTQSQQITDGQTYTSSYEYDFGGRLVKEIYPSLREVKHEYEADGDLMRVFGKANPNATDKTYVNSFSYTASGGISRMRLGNGKWETAKFNDRQQITELGLGNSATDASVWKVNYDYGEIEDNGTLSTNKNTGNIARQTLSFAGLSNPLVQTYKYDSLYRLKEAKETSNSATNWIQSYNYDRYGNRTGFNENIGGIANTQTPAIDPLTNRFTSTNFTYDKNGNITKDISRFSQARTFVFNAENKQTEIKDANGTPIGKYYYDGEGKRVKKVTDTETTVFVYSAGKLVAEYSTKTPPQIPTTSYMTTDHLGTPRVITDAFGQVKSRRDFMPFGEELTINVGGRNTNLKYGGNADDTRQKFTGYQKDTETELDFAEARMYENRYARFTAVDPLLSSGNSADPQSFNRYIYVYNNPLSFTDPTGECPTGGCPNFWSGAVYQRTDGNGKTWYNNEQPDNSWTTIPVGFNQTITDDTTGIQYQVYNNGEELGGAGWYITSYEPVVNNLLPRRWRSFSFLGQERDWSGISLRQEMQNTITADGETNIEKFLDKQDEHKLMFLFGATQYANLGAIRSPPNIPKINRQPPPPVNPNLAINTPLINFANLPSTGKINPVNVRFSQNSIRSTFKDGTNVESLISGLKNGTIDPSSVNPIRIVQKGGLIYTLDNRRLYAFQQAGVPINYIKLNHVPKKQAFKFTTTNSGASIKVRQ